MDLVRPDYGGACIDTLVPALREGAPWLPEPARDVRQVVLLVLDGLGWELVQALAPPTLVAMMGGPITSVVPSTTPTALTSISTSLPPSRHGIIGYRMLTDDGILNVIRWQLHGGGRTVAPEHLQPREAFGGQPVPVVTRAQFAGSGFSQILYRGCPLHGWLSTSSIVEHCRRLVAAGERLVYAYYDGPDLVAHMHGLRDGFFSREVALCDGLVGDLLDALPPDCALVVTADHGHVHFEERIGLSEVAPLVRAQSGEPRFRYLHAVPGAEGDLVAEAEHAFARHTLVLSREQVIDEGWLGPPPPPDIRRRIGDVVLAAVAPVAYDDPGNPGERAFLSGHGSVTAEEMLVPLLAARGQGRRRV